MRNLKRALSLAMASVMLLGMMVVGTGASYADVDSADNVEAIEVMQAIGVMVGDTNGNFNPDQKVTRVEMAVVMANLLDLKVEDFVGAKIPFTDVPEWAVPYVAACYADGITAGISATQYGSNYEVTTAQAALMMMKALGYFQYTSDFGSDWQVATVKQGSKIDLFDGVEAGASAAMTRNDVAQIALNTLEANMVEATKNGSTIIVGDITVTGDVEYKDYVVANGTAWAKSINKDQDSDNKEIVQLGENLFNGDLKKSAVAADNLGRPAYTWEYKNDEIGSYADEASETIVVADDSIQLGDVLVGNDDYFDLEDNKDIDLGNDNAQVADWAGQINGKTASTSGTLTEGTVVEIYRDENDVVTYVAAMQYTAAKIDEVTTDLSSSEEKAGASYSINLTTMDGSSLGNTTYYDKHSTDSKVLPGFSANSYKEGTVLAVVLDGDDNSTILDSYVANVVTGTVSSYQKDKYVTVSGTKYNMAGNAGDAVDGITDGFSFEDEYNLYLTKDNYVIAVDGAAEASIDDVYYVTGVYQTKSDMGTVKYYAQAVALDGTVSIIELEESEFQSGGAFNGKGANWDDTVAGLYTLTDSANGSDKSGNDKYNADAFTANDNYTVKANGTLSASVAKDDTNMTVGSTKVYMNKDTKYIAVEKAGDDIDVSTAVGGMKCAKTDADKVLVISNKDDDRTAVYVLYIGDDLSSSVVSDDVVYVAEKSNEKNSDGYVTTLYFMDGNTSKEVTVKTQENPGFYNYDVDNDGIYTLQGISGLGSTTVDDDTSGWDTVTFDSNNIYGTNNLLTVDNFTDIAFGSAKVIDSRSDDAIKASAWDREISSVANLKNAAEKANITARVYVTDGEITFIDVVSLTGAELPNISRQPTGTTVTAGSISGSLTVTASSTDQGTLSYQWYKDGAKMDGETNASLTIPTSLTAGTYKFYVVVTNTKSGETNSLQSDEVTVTVKPATPTWTDNTSVADVSDKTVTIKADSTAFTAGTYTLYKAGVSTGCTVVVSEAVDELAFTGVEGLEQSETQFTITVTVNGQESAQSAQQAITPGA